MKLYYAPGACSLATHILLCEVGAPFTTEKVNLQTKKTASGADYTAINSKGAVPALLLDDGQLLTEVAVILQYLADQKPDAALAPRAGSFERYRLLEILNYIATEVHKGFGPLFNPKASADWKAGALANLSARFDWLTGQLAGKSYLLGERFSIADAYLFTVLGWSGHVGIDLAKWPALAAYRARVGLRPKVQEALRAEGLLS
ncbi:MAG TPA: glutathione transferase GstA [Steroidobacteraceae bacterium]|nr:glutathione transferase GstA [Steroidobacteraceae bacterium]